VEKKKTTKRGATTAVKSQKSSKYSGNYNEGKSKLDSFGKRFGTLFKNPGPKNMLIVHGDNTS